MNYIKQIEKYIPECEQEEADKKLILDFIKNSKDVLLRKNKVAHLTASSWIVNKDRTKVLLAYHKIYDSWSWTGGHVDGCSNLLKVAIKEAKEETGIVNVKPIKKDIFSIESLCVNGHIKNDEYVPSHLHLNVTYLLEADESDELKVSVDENLAVKWFKIDEVYKVVNEVWMIDNIYRKLNRKLKIIS